MNTTYLSMPPVAHPMVRRIVDRSHVADSILTVCREVLPSFGTKPAKGTIRTGWRTLPKTHRRYLIAAIIQAHKENRVTYRQVMHQSREEFVPSYFFDAATKHTHIAPAVLPA